MANKAPALDRQPPAATPDRQPPAAPPFDLNLWLHKSNELMLVVQIFGNGSSWYSLISTKHDSFKLVVKDDISSLSALLKCQNCNPELYGKPYDYQVITACNPWILVTCGEIDGTGLQHLWNPFTNELKTLPPFMSQPPLPFPLDKGITFYGLGIDPSSGDYKIVKARVLDKDPDEDKLRRLLEDEDFDEDKLRRLLKRESSDIEVWFWDNGNWSKEHSFTVPAEVSFVSGLFRKNKLLLVNSKCELLLYDCGTNNLANLCTGDDNLVRQMHRLFERSSI